MSSYFFFFFFQAEDGIRDYKVTGVQTCALPIWSRKRWPWPRSRLFRPRQSSQFHSRWLQPQPNSRRCQRQWLICRALCEVKKGVVLVWRFGLAFCLTRSLGLFNACPRGFLL